jgi:hypothetical protein
MSAMLQARLMVIMQRELDTSRLQLSPYCKKQIEQLVTRAVTRMHNNKVADNPGRLMNAERNLRALVKYLHDHSQATGSFPRLTDTDFDTAMRVCPTFWPYCSSE